MSQIAFDVPKAADTFEVGVRFSLPSNNPDKPIKGKVVAVYKFLDDKEHRKLSADATAVLNSVINVGVSRGEEDREFIDFGGTDKINREILDATLVGIKGLGDNGQLLEPDAAVTWAINHPKYADAFIPALANGYLNGRKGVSAKN